jgi:hypothetical protein
MSEAAGRLRPKERNLAERSVVEWNRQRTATQAALCQKYELENQITLGQVLNRAQLAQALSLIAEAISSRVMSCTELPLAAREDILKDLASWPLVLEEVARGQSRLRRGNGQPEADGSES